MGAVILASTLYSTTLPIASTLLPQMQGTMAATAVVTPLTGWLVGRFDRRGVMMRSLPGFTIATWFCGASDSLFSPVFWRIVQDGGVTSIFGMAVVIGPVIGPTLGGFPAQEYTWRRG